MMECIDFDQHFADYLADWTKKHRADYTTFDEMEDDVPKVYQDFLNTPAKWLRGITPGSYFTQYEDPKLLVDWLEAYGEAGVPVPDLLPEQIVFVGKPCEKRLVSLLKSNALNESKMLAIELLRELESTQPKMLYIDWQLNRQEDDELADNALESLLAMGSSAVQPMIEALPQCNAAGEEALLDVLSHYPGDDRVFRLALRLFNESTDKKALFASYLGKLGDSRALSDLIAAAKDDRTRYLDFIEIRCAIETLGGDCPERDFGDDPDYDALSALDGRIGSDQTPKEDESVF